MADPVGPVFTGGFEEFVIQDGSPATPPTTPVGSGTFTSLATSAKPRPPLRGRQEEGAYG